MLFAVRYSELRHGKPTPKQSWLKPGGPLSGSYSGVPKESQKIKVYARKVNESYDGIYPDWYDGLQAHVSEVELSCWCAEAEHSGKIYVCLEDVAQLAIHNSPHLTRFVSANDSAELWLPS